LSFVCENFCYKNIFLDGQLPVYSHLNNMNLEEPPDVIFNLNLYERMLIKLGKVFQTVIKLQAYRRYNTRNATPALKGTSFHLPLNTNQTNQYIDKIPYLITKASTF
jgi:hypothetical protein